MSASGQSSSQSIPSALSECDLLAKLSTSMKNLKDASNTVVQYSMSLLQMMLSNETRKHEFPQLVHRFYRYIEEFYNICLQTRQLLQLASTALNQTILSKEYTKLPVRDSINLKSLSQSETMAYSDYITVVKEQVARATKIEEMLKRFSHELAREHCDSIQTISI